jgi:carbon monoxide dehydrogenase subunit G
MHFEQSIDIDVWQQRVWEVLSDLEAWPQHIETVDVVECSHPILWVKAAACVSSNRSCQRAHGRSLSGMRRPTSSSARSQGALPMLRAIVSRRWRKAALA